VRSRVRDNLLARPRQRIRTSFAWRFQDGDLVSVDIPPASSRRYYSLLLTGLFAYLRRKCLRNSRLDRRVNNNVSPCCRNMWSVRTSFIVINFAFRGYTSARTNGKSRQILFPVLVRDFCDADSITRSSPRPLHFGTFRRCSRSNGRTGL